jgi:hypothetical protein
MKLKLFILLATLIAIRCSTTNLAGGTSSSENTKVMGVVVDTAGAGVADVQVKLVPSAYVPVSPQPGSTLLADTTDTHGCYAFTVDRRGLYTILANDANTGRLSMRKNVAVTGDTVRVTHDTLRNPGTIRVVLPDSVAALAGYVYLQGTDICTYVSGPVAYLDSVPAGESPSLCWVLGSSNTAGVPIQLADSVNVVENDTAAIARALLVLPSAQGTSDTNAVSFMAKLKETGLVLSVKTDVAVSVGDIAGVDIIILAPGTNRTAATTFRDMPLPIIDCAYNTLGALGMTADSGGQSVSYGITPPSDVNYNWWIGDTTHPIAKNCTRYFSPSSNALRENSWGVPGANAQTVVVLMPGADIAQSPVFCYDRGVVMTAVAAPARRCAFLFLSAETSHLVDNVWLLLKNAVDWSLE